MAPPTRQFLYPLEAERHFPSRSNLLSLPKSYEIPKNRTPPPQNSSPAKRCTKYDPSSAPERSPKRARYLQDGAQATPNETTSGSESYDSNHQVEEELDPVIEWEEEYIEYKRGGTTQATAIEISDSEGEHGDNNKDSEDDDRNYRATKNGDEDEDEDEDEDDEIVSISKSMWHWARHKHFHGVGILPNDTFQDVPINSVEGVEGSDESNVLVGVAHYRSFLESVGDDAYENVETSFEEYRRRPPKYVA